MKRLIYILLTVLICFCFVGCNNEEQDENEATYLYYISTDRSILEPTEYEIKAKDVEGQVNELFDNLKKSQENLNITSSIPADVNLVKIEIINKQANLYFSNEYHNMNQSTEILMRAAVVKTMVQIAEIDYVSFYVGEEALKDVSGNVIGLMNDATFVLNASSSLYTYQTTDLNLYFSNKKGTSLRKVKKQNVRYTVNTSIEKLVMEQLMKGPTNSDYSSTITNQTTLLGVSVKDGICYVNLSNSFLTATYNQNPEVVIYSIVNSLIENANVLKVQILIEGSGEVMFMNSIDLARPLEWNANIIKGAS